MVQWLPDDDLPPLPPHPADAHKGTFGTALVVGGSVGMAGAPALTAKGALRSGAGLVRVAAPAPVAPTVAAFDPCYTVIPLSSDAAGRLGQASYEPLQLAAQAASALAIGPGLGRSWELEWLVGRLFSEQTKAMVVDADALNALAAEPQNLRPGRAARVLTPHPGEFARLIGRKLEGDERIAAAENLAAQLGAIVVLKGRHTLVTDGHRSWRNTTGNSGMATGGSGDVLTGMIAALLGQGMAPFDAARLGVYAHGLAGDLAAEAIGPIGMTAADIVEWLPRAWVRLSTESIASARTPDRP